MTVGGGVDELCGDADAVALSPNAPLEDVGNPQLRPICLSDFVLPL
jgi:hypothetical protein